MLPSRTAWTECRRSAAELGQPRDPCRRGRVTSIARGARRQSGRRPARSHLAATAPVLGRLEPLLVLSVASGRDERFGIYVSMAEVQLLRDGLRAVVEATTARGLDVMAGGRAIWVFKGGATLP